MGSIVVLFGVRADYPLVVASNRDELHTRAASGALRLLELPRTVGGLDMLRRGTWQGVTREGLYVGVTGQHALQPSTAAQRSRGELVINALKLGLTDAVTRMVRSLDARDFNGFNLLWGDADQLWLGHTRPGRAEVELEKLTRGVHVLPDGPLNSPDFPKVRRAQKLLDPYVHASWPYLEDALKKTLADRERPPTFDVPMLATEAPISRETLRELSPLCVRTPLFGTRASAIVAITRGKVGHYLYADGPPDRAPFQDVTRLFL